MNARALSRILNGRQRWIYQSTLGRVEEALQKMEREHAKKLGYDQHALTGQVVGADDRAPKGVWSLELIQSLDDPTIDSRVLAKLTERDKQLIYAVALYDGIEEVRKRFRLRRQRELTLKSLGAQMLRGSLERRFSSPEDFLSPDTREKVIKGLVGVLMHISTLASRVKACLERHLSRTISFSRGIVKLQHCKTQVRLFVVLTSIEGMLFDKEVAEYIAERAVEEERRTQLRVLKQVPTSG